MVLMRQGEAVTADPEAALVAAAIRRRLDGLATACGVVWEQSVVAQDAQADCRGLVLACFPAKGATHPGFIGEIAAAGTDQTMRHWLAAACVVNAGRHAVYGAGAWVPLG